MDGVNEVELVIVIVLFLPKGIYGSLQDRWRR